MRWARFAVCVAFGWASARAAGEAGLWLLPVLLVLFFAYGELQGRVSDDFRSGDS